MSVTHTSPKPTESIPGNNDLEVGQLSLDVYETPTELILIAPIAGVKLEDINLSITDDVLTISGSRHLEYKLANEEYLIQECFWGDFSRSIMLPDNIDSSKIAASFKDGVLKVSIPRTQGTNKTKLIKIKSN